MPMTTISSHELNQDASAATRAANDGPVFITDQGRPAHVLLSIEEYQRLQGSSPKIADLLAMPDSGPFELEIPLQREVPKPAKFP